MAENSFAHHFSRANIPFGIASSPAHPSPSAVTRIHDDVIFLDILHDTGLFNHIAELSPQIFKEPTLNSFASLGRPASTSVRTTIQKAFAPQSSYSAPTQAIEPISSVKMHMPMHVHDFTDFSCSGDHLLNSGEALFGTRYLPPGFPHYPLGYGGRSGSIVVSGTDVQRPLGQYRSKKEPEKVLFGASQALDYELELGVVIGKPVPMGATATAAEADEHIFGVVLLNDWTARDILGLEMLPLGPLNGKSFMTSISPWVVTLDALEPFAVPAPVHDLPVAPYLEDPNPNGTYAIELRAEIITAGTSTQVCMAKTEWAYWSFRHIFAHQAVGGCGLHSGDIVATGTLSGTTPDSLGCLLELTMNGKKSFNLKNGFSRTYLEDGDGVRTTGFAGSERDGVGFGECIGEVLPATVLRPNINGHK